MSLHPAVDLLLARMESHPDEFTLPPTRWGWLLIETFHIANPEEQKLMQTKLRELRGTILHERIMEELLSDATSAKYDNIWGWAKPKVEGAPR